MRHLPRGMLATILLLAACAAADGRTQHPTVLEVTNGTEGPLLVFLAYGDVAWGFTSPMRPGGIATVEVPAGFVAPDRTIQIAVLAPGMRGPARLSKRTTLTLGDTTRVPITQADPEPRGQVGRSG